MAQSAATRSAFVGSMMEHVLAERDALRKALETIRDGFWTDGETDAERVAQLQEIAAHALSEKGAPRERRRPTGDHAMSDPTYDKDQINANIEWQVAFSLSEILNDNAPIGWSKYIGTAQCLLANWEMKRKESF